MAVELPSIDAANRTISYAGVKVSWELFEFFSREANRGSLFIFVALENGVVSVRQVPEVEFGRA